MIRTSRVIYKAMPSKLARALSTNVPILPIKKLQFDTLIELQQESTKAYSTNPMFGTRNGNVYEWINYAEFDVEVAKCRIVLKENKIGKDDKVALISNNRLEWATLKYATVGLGGQIVPMYEAQLEKDWKYILEDSDARVLVVATEAIYQQCKDYPGKVRDTSYY